ncbi:hypothetical protein G9C85_17365 [Halorubellus sp. JP-L1]|uniref:hypothetical protein n=1 Tax=Halorubellus sp. JP-L1 TaxID=2715753 RepID=UPI00140D8CD8|nr:hypothetical protein [Halorubellus sp. JP-L1]NHN43389.1 hypothetical protein [Halorubellus sp. JP-L1]
MRQITGGGGGGRSRRAVLRRSGAALAAATAGASAGCTNLLPPASRTIRYGDVDVPRRGDATPSYRRWFPAVSELPAIDEPGHDEDDPYGNWTYVTPGDLGAAQLGRPFDIGRSVAQSTMDYVGYPLDAYDRLVGVDPIGTVAEADVDRSVVERTLAATTYERADDFRGYDVYDRTDLERLVAVSDDALVHASGENRREKARVLADAGAGRVDRRHEVDETFAAYTEHVGAAPTVLDAFGLLDGAIESGLRFTFDESSAYFVHEHAFADGETPSAGEVKRQISGITRGRRATRVDVTVDDPFVRVALRLDESVYMNGDDADDYRSLPFVTWGVDDRPDAITVRHDAGEAVPVEHVDFEPSDALVDPPAPGSTLEPGDELAFATADMTDGDDVEFAYRHAEHSTSLLFHYDPENASTT